MALKVNQDLVQWSVTYGWLIDQSVMCAFVFTCHLSVCPYTSVIFSLQNLWVGTKQCRNGVCEVFNTNSSFLHALAKTMATMFLIFLTSNNLSKFKVPVFVIWYKWFCEVIYTNSSFHIDQGKNMQRFWLTER